MPGLEKQYEDRLTFALSSDMKQFLREEGERRYPEDKKGAMGRIVRQAILEHWVLTNQKEER